MFSNWQYRLLAVALALICWYLVTGRDKVDTWMEVPVELVKTSPDMVIREGLTTKINARIRGPKAMVRALDPKSLAYPLDLSSLETGVNVITFSPGEISVTGALTVVEVNPPRMELLVDRLISAQVEVTPDLDVHLDEDYELVRSASRPVAVTLRGPEQVLAGIESAATRLISVNATKPDMMSFDVGLALPSEVDAEPDTVRVDLYFGEKTKDVWVETAVRVVPEDVKGVTASPRTVKLQVRAPVSQVRRKEFKDEVSATVVIPSDLVPGRHTMAYRIKLPPGCAMVKAVPEQVDVRLKK